MPDALPQLLLELDPGRVVRLSRESEVLWSAKLDKNLSQTPILHGMTTRRGRQVLHRWGPMLPAFSAAMSAQVFGGETPVAINAALSSRVGRLAIRSTAGRTVPQFPWELLYLGERFVRGRGISVVRDVGPAPNRPWPREAPMITVARGWEAGGVERDSIIDAATDGFDGSLVSAITHGDGVIDALADTDIAIIVGQPTWSGVLLGKDAPLLLPTQDIIGALERSRCRLVVLVQTHTGYIGSGLFFDLIAQSIAARVGVAVVSTLGSTPDFEACDQIEQLGETIRRCGWDLEHAVHILGGAFALYADFSRRDAPRFDDDEPPDLFPPYPPDVDVAAWRESLEGLPTAQRHPLDEALRCLGPRARIPPPHDDPVLAFQDLLRLGNEEDPVTLWEQVEGFRQFVAAHGGDDGPSPLLSVDHVTTAPPQRSGREDTSEVARPAAPARSEARRKGSSTWRPGSKPPKPLPAARRSKGRRKPPPTPDEDAPTGPQTPLDAPPAPRMERRQVDPAVEPTEATDDLVVDVPRPQPPPAPAPRPRPRPAAQDPVGLVLPAGLVDIVHAELDAGRPVALVGPTGVGKTTLARAVAEARGHTLQVCTSLESWPESPGARGKWLLVDALTDDGRIGRLTGLVLSRSPQVLVTLEPSAVMALPRTLRRRLAFVDMAPVTDYVRELAALGGYDVPGVAAGLWADTRRFVYLARTWLDVGTGQLEAALGFLRATADRDLSDAQRLGQALRSAVVPTLGRIDPGVRDVLAAWSEADHTATLAAVITAVEPAVGNPSMAPALGDVGDDLAKLTGRRHVAGRLDILAAALWSS